MTDFWGIVRLLLFIAAVSADGLCSAFGLGASGISIPARSAVVISCSGAAFLVLSAAIGGTVGKLVPIGVCSALSTVILLLLGIFNLFHRLFERIGEKLPKKSKLRVYFSDDAADCDSSKDISSKEALVLSVALSADSLAAGIGVGLDSYSLPAIAVTTFFMQLCFVVFANKLGKKALCGIGKKRIDLRMICGVLLITIAVIK